MRVRYEADDFLHALPFPPFPPFLPSESVLRKRFVRIAIQPALAWLGGRDDRMAARLCMLRRVAIRRRIAAIRAAATLAGAQVHPL